MPDQPQQKRAVSRRQFIRGAGVAIAGATVAGNLIANKKGSAPDASQGVIEEGSTEITLRVNGKRYTLSVPPRVTLLDALRERLQLTGAKRICDRGNCGGCTILMDGKPVYACMMLAVDSQKAEITTVEGLGSPEKMSALQKQFVDKDGLMCGFCTPGFVVACHAALKTNPNATLEDIKAACSGNICRCGTFNRVFEAALAAAREVRGA